MCSSSVASVFDLTIYNVHMYNIDGEMADGKQQTSVYYKSIIKCLVSLEK